MAARTKVFVDIITKSDGKEPGAGLKKYAIGAGIAAVAIAGLIKVGKELENIYAVQEQAEARLEQTIRATGQAAGFTSKEMFDMASGLQEVTKFGDEAIIGAESLLLTFKDIGGDIFPRALESILDVSEAMGTDLQSSTIQLGKALNDPILGLTSLSRSGIQFTEAQKETIKTMVEMGDKAGAQTIILEELESQFGGVARAAAETSTGVGVQLNNSFGDLKETLGGVISDALVPYRLELMDEIVAVNNSIKAHFLRGKALRGEATVIEELVLRELEQAKTEDKLAQAKENLVRAENATIEVVGISNVILRQREAALKKGIEQAKLTIIGLEDELVLRRMSTNTAQKQFDAEQDLLDVKLATFEATEDLNKATEDGNELGEEEIIIAQTAQEIYDAKIDVINAERDAQRARIAEVLPALEEEIDLVEELNQTYLDLAKTGLGAFAQAFEEVGAGNIDLWEGFKEAGKDAVSALLKALAEMALVEAAIAAASLRFVKAGLFLAAASAAYAASGLVQSFETGGKFITQGETTFKAGEQGQEEVIIKPISGGNNTGGDISGQDRIWIQVEDSGGFWGVIQRGVDNRKFVSHTGDQL